MVKITNEDKSTIRSILTNYDISKYDVIMNKMRPILEKYHPSPEKLAKRLLHSLLSSWLAKENEQIVHYHTFCKLVIDYGYSPDQLGHEIPCGALGRASSTSATTHADIVVYTSQDRTPDSAIVVIECRELNGTDGIAQAASYSRALSAKYHVFTDSKKWLVFETQPYPLNGIQISDIPRWVGYKPLAARLSKNILLPPIKDESQLRSLIDICHNVIHAEGIDPAKAFDEIVKLFFIKVYDEQEIPNKYEFSVLTGETDDETGEHIRRLLKKAKTMSKYKDLFVEPGDDEFAISNHAIRVVVETFQGFSFVSNSRIGIDAKGTVYENMVGSTFRGELGQYFTPRKVVEFMVDMMEPDRTDLVLDPACGSGGFLITVLGKVANKIRIEQSNLSLDKVEMLIKDYANQRLKGVDINPRMVRASRMNMIMHGDGWAGIHRDHGLKIQNASADIIFSNPPFAGFETDMAILQNFDTGKNEAGNTRGVNRAIVFVEQIIRLLNDGGKTALVLPRSIFELESYSFQKLRDFILRRCEILAVIGLPDSAFHHTDCQILGDLLFLRKCKKPRKDYDVFVTCAKNVGYNTLGHNIDENDFIKILDNYKNQNKEFLIPLSQLVAENTWNPWHYHPESIKIRKEVEKNKSHTVPLTQLVSLYKNRISKKILKQTPNRIITYYEVKDFDPITGKSLANERINRKAKDLPSRATYELNGEELILLPNAKHSIISNRQIFKIGQETNGAFLTNRFTPLRAKVNPDFLLFMLNTKFVRDQILQKCTGAGSPDLNVSKLDQILIPVPDPKDLNTIDAFMENLEDHLAKKSQLETELAKENKYIEKELDNLINNEG